MDVNAILESLFRWIHVVAGVVWIGHLYFFNFVNATFAPTLDGDSKKKVVPELMPRALYFFRWGAAFTWVTGVLLLGLVFYMQRGIGNFQAEGRWTAMAGVMVALTFLSPLVYEVLVKTAMKTLPEAFWVGWAVISVVYLVFHHLGGLTFRGSLIHLGAAMGTIMAYNVWFRIWPAQQTIITAVKNGEAPDQALVALAGARSRHNTFMSLPLIFAMLDQHGTWAAGSDPLTFAVADLYVPIVALVGLALTQHLYQISRKVKGF